MKRLEAYKVKDGYYVKITDTIAVGCESDVYKLVRENGLKIKIDDGDYRIVAE